MCTALALSPPPHRLLPQGSGVEYGQGAPVGRRDVDDCEGDVAVRAVTDRSKEGVRNSVRFGAAVPVTCRPAPVRRGPWMPRSPDTLPAPEYRLALRVGFVPTPRAVMQAVFPWRQGTPRAAVIARMKFSLAELVRDRYRVVVSSDLCPRSSWIAQISTLASSRWVAKPW